MSSLVLRSSSLNLSPTSDLEQSDAPSEPPSVFFASSSLYNIIHHHRQQDCLLFRPSWATSHAMARLHIAALLSPDQEEQLSALRTLKNEIVGHDQKKERWVENGIIEPVVKILESSRSSPSTNGKDSSRGRIPPSRPLTGEESVRLQALQILASLANGTATPGSMPRTLCVALANNDSQVALLSWLPYSQLAPCPPYYQTYPQSTTHLGSWSRPSELLSILLKPRLWLHPPPLQTSLIWQVLPLCRYSSMPSAIF